MTIRDYTILKDAEIALLESLSKVSAQKVKSSLVKDIISCLAISYQTGHSFALFRFDNDLDDIGKYVVRALSQDYDISPDYVLGSQSGLHEYQVIVKIKPLNWEDKYQFWTINCNSHEITKS